MSRGQRFISKKSGRSISHIVCSHSCAASSPSRRERETGPYTTFRSATRASARRRRSPVARPGTPAGPRRPARACRPPGPRCRACPAAVAAARTSSGDVSCFASCSCGRSLDRAGRTPRRPLHVARARARPAIRRVAAQRPRTACQAPSEFSSRLKIRQSRWTSPASASRRSHTAPCHAHGQLGVDPQPHRCRRHASLRSWVVVLVGTDATRNRISTRVPPPSALCTDNAPPHRSARSPAIASPRPEPPGGAALPR